MSEDLIDTNKNASHKGEVKREQSRHITRRHPSALIVVCVAVVALVAIVAIFLLRKKEAPPVPEKAAAENQSETATEVMLPPESMTTAGIEIVGVTVRPAVALLSVTGTVEANQRQRQEVAPLVSGTVRQVFVALGDRVRASATLAAIYSPQIAEMRGNLRSAETKLLLAERNFARVQRAENRAAVLQARAKLDEAEATLRRTRRLVELGVGAGKDLIAAEAAYKTAKAEYDFQSNIALNREVQQAQGDVETARNEVVQLRQALVALGASPDKSLGSAAVINLRAPVSGTVIDRVVNPGAAVEAGKPVFAIANLATVWVIANVPEASVSAIHVGTPAEIRLAALREKVITSRVDYIDPVINEETRTARVRIETANVGEQLKVGMFVKVGIQSGSGGEVEELVVPAEAVQRLGEREVVFLPKQNQPGHFEVRTVDLGEQVQGYRRVNSGLKVGDQVVTKGSFILKSQMMKGQFGEEDEEEKKKP